VDMKRVANLFAEAPESIVIGNEERAFTMLGNQIVVSRLRNIIVGHRLGTYDMD